MPHKINYRKDGKRRDIKKEARRRKNPLTDMEKSRVKIKLKNLKMYEVQSSYIVFLHAHRKREDGGLEEKG